MAKAFDETAFREHLNESVGDVFEYVDKLKVYIENYGTREEFPLVMKIYASYLAALCQTRALCRIGEQYFDGDLDTAKLDSHIDETREQIRKNLESFLEDGEGIGFPLLARSSFGLK